MRSKIAVGTRQRLPIVQAEAHITKALTQQNPHWYVDKQGNCPRSLDYQFRLADPEFHNNA